LQLAILKSVQQMIGFKDDVGEPLNQGARDFVVMVPTTYWAPALTALSVAQLTSGQTNVLANIDGFNLQLVANPRLTWTDKFATFRADMGDGAAPFIKQEEVPLNVSFQAEGSKEEYDNKRHTYSVDWVGNFGPGFWQHANLTTLI
jgi:phage major head subunit gpT-like protein